jgi:hypothetical protein
MSPPRGRWMLSSISERLTLVRGSALPALDVPADPLVGAYQRTLVIQRSNRPYLPVNAAQSAPGAKR